MKKNLYIGLLSVAILTTSCNVDLLNIPQEGVVSEENFYKTDDDCNEAITAVYNIFRSAYSGDIADIFPYERVHVPVSAFRGESNPGCPGAHVPVGFFK